MKKMFRNLFLAVALAVAAPSFMSCTHSQIEDVADSISEGIGKGFDFNSAVDCFQTYPDWNNESGCYENSFDTKEHAKQRIEKYVNKRMSVPGVWKINRKNYIKVEEGTGDVWYKITVRSEASDNKPASNYTTLFKKLNK